MSITSRSFYFDTSIWIDIYEQRGYNGEKAEKLLKKIIMDDEMIIYSDVVVTELKEVGFSDHEIYDMMRIAKPDHIKLVHTKRSQFQEAKKLAKQRTVPLRDALHAVLARDHETQLISRDWDFEKLKDVTKARKPEDVL